MADYHDFAEVKRTYQGREVVGISDSGVAGALRIMIRIVIPPAVRNCPVVLREWTYLVRPVAAVAQRTVNEDHGDVCSFFHIVQRNTVSNIRRTDDRRCGSSLGNAGAREQDENERKNSDAVT